LRLLSYLFIFVLTTLIAVPSYSDDITINLDQTTPYVDVPVTVTEPVDATIQTVTGTPDENFIDSWIELWQDTTRLAYNDDGAHSVVNVLASVITMPLQIGEYFIRATSYAYTCCNVYPTGSYLLSTNLIVATPTPTISLSPTPSPTETETPSPTPTPSETSTVQPSPEPSPTPSETQLPQENLPGPETPQQVEPSQESLPILPTVEPQVSVVPVEPSVLPTPDVTSTSISYPSYEPSSSTDEYLSETVFLGISLPPGVSEATQLVSEAISNSLETISNLGSEFTPEERKQAQQVILGAIIITQLASPRRVK
jgi:hypothetical protein